MLHIRSLAFNFVFYVSLIAQMIFWTPYYFLSPRATAPGSCPNSGRVRACGCYDKIAGTKSEVTRLENLPAGSFILAPKHQSFWDAIAFFPYLRDPLYILKRELMWIPFFGWYVMPRCEDDPGGPGQALGSPEGRCRGNPPGNARNDRQLIIYPEGTRRAPGDEPAYKWGIAETLRGSSTCPSCPSPMSPASTGRVASSCAYPGTIKARFLKPIPAGLSREDEFMQRLISETEAACDRVPDRGSQPRKPRRRCRRRR
jgi:1-acyl-sn-glycerol-3-phosphate acyltransferase